MHLAIVPKSKTELKKKKHNNLTTPSNSDTFNIRLSIKNN